MTGYEWRVLLEAAALTPVAALAVRVAPLPKAVGLLRTVAGCRRPRQRADAGPRTPSLDRVAALVGWTVSRFGARCLVQALVLQAVLQRRGVRADVVLGTTASGPAEDGAPGGLAAHAWVEHEGRVLMGAAGVPYAPLCRLSGDRTMTTGPTGPTEQGALV